MGAVPPEGTVGPLFWEVLTPATARRNLVTKQYVEAQAGVAGWECEYCDRWYRELPEGTCDGCGAPTRPRRALRREAERLELDRQAGEVMAYAVLSHRLTQPACYARIINEGRPGRESPGIFRTTMAKMKELIP